MWKTTLISLAFAGTAFAQPAPPPQFVKLSVSVGPRTHVLVISDRGCGVVKEKTQAYEDDFTLCSQPTANGIALAVDANLRVGQTEYRMKSESNMTRKGSIVEAGRKDGNLLFTIKTL